MTKIRTRSPEIPEFLPYVRTDERRATIEAGLARFDRHEHRDAILAILRSVHERGTKPGPFDADKSWRYLIGLAEYYFWKATEDSMLPATRAKRLRELASALGRAHALVDKAMQDDVGGDLFYAWWGGPSDPDADGVCLNAAYFEPAFQKEVAIIDTLAAAARRAANDVPAKQGRPKGTGVLPRGFIERLAAVYRDRTGEKPGAGDGPFAKFVRAVLDALGRYNDAEDERVTGALKYESVIDAIKDARASVLKRPSPGMWGAPSFDRRGGKFPSG